jgi:hypothetical protein
VPLFQELQRLLESNVNFVATSGDDGGVGCLGRRNRRIEAHEGTFSPQKEPPPTTNNKRAAAPSRLAASKARHGVAAGKAAAAAARHAKIKLDAVKQARLNRLRREVEIVGAPGGGAGEKRVTRAQAASVQGPGADDEDDVDDEEADDEDHDDDELSGDSAHGGGEEDDDEGEDGEEEEEEGTEMWHTGRKYELRARPKTQVKRYSPRPRSNKPR